MSTLFAFLVRFVLVAAGLVLAASVLVAAALGMLLWGLHAGWARLTGRPARPLPFRAFRHVRWPSQGFGTPRRAPVRVRVPAHDVTDVEPK